MPQGFGTLACRPVMNPTGSDACHSCRPRPGPPHVAVHCSTHCREMRAPLMRHCEHVPPAECACIAARRPCARCCDTNR
eukprot:1124782-Lingulodinium_polyedra.AAC.1